MSTQQLDRLLGFLAADPGNARLLQDCASAAMDAHQYDTAAALVARAEAEGPLASELLNLKGVMAMMHQDHAAAQLAFQALLDAGVNDTGIRFNLAWSKAMLGEYTDAEALLDDAVVTAVPRAAGLKIQMLHHLQRMDDAFAHGARYAKQYPHDQALFGALAILALDADKADLAAYYAQQAQATPEGLSTLGSLLLGEGQAADSQSYFAEAIRLNPSSGRSWLGQGLAGISQGASSQAAADLDHAAGLLKTHLGSWIAAGWAHFINQDVAAARVRFETAMALDARFSECHGGLAVLDMIEGNLGSARKRTERALRLDPSCFSGALARSLLLANSGNPQVAEEIRDKALNMPISETGLTIAQAIVHYGLVNQLKKGNTGSH